MVSFHPDRLETLKECVMRDGETIGDEMRQALRNVERAMLVFQSTIDNLEFGRGG